MATYKAADLFKILCNIIDSGYDYIEIEEAEADEDFPASLGFDVIIDKSFSEGFQEIESTEVPQDYCFGYSTPTFEPDDISRALTFTFEELCTLMNAVDNALEYGKERLASPTCTKNEKDIIKSSSIECRNLQAKFAKFRKKYGIRCVDTSRN